jgi:acetyltransferase
MPLPGGIAFVSHSGALAVAILDWARDRRVGFSLFASLGNQADLNESDLLEAATEDPETRVITAYLEGVADGRRFLGALGAATRVKPVVLLKAGRSAEGARAVSSHTGALAGSDEAFGAAVKQTGAVRARTVEELFDLARALASQPLPAGRRLVVVTNGGGLGIVATDAAHDAGLEVGPLAEATRARLARALPGAALPGNPVDLVGDADAARYGNALHALGEDAGDAMLVLLTAQAVTDAAGVARAVAAATRGWRIPVAAAFVGGARVAPGIVALEEAGLPCYPFPERAVAALAGMAAVVARRRRHVGGARCPSGSPSEAARAVLDGLTARGAGRLGMSELAPLLEAWGIGVVKVRAAATPADVARAAAQLGFPVALKIASADVSHKTEAGGVALALSSAEETARTAEAMLGRVRAARPDARIDGFIVQRMARPGRELLVGMVRDPQFGPVIIVGAGGIYVEALRDTSARLVPLGPADAGEMLDELRIAPILRGVRGQPPVDRAALVDTICRFAALAGEAGALEEIEINPLMVDEQGAVAVDARARLA